MAVMMATCQIALFFFKERNARAWYVRTTQGCGDVCPPLSALGIGSDVTAAKFWNAIRRGICFLPDSGQHMYRFAQRQNEFWG